MVGSSSFEVVVVPSGAAAVGSGEPCEGGSGAEGAAGEWSAHAPGREVVLSGAKGGADGSADAADAEKAFGRIAVNWK